MDVLDGTRWDQHNLPGTDRGSLIIDRHDAGSFEDIIDFGAFLQFVRES